METERSKDIKAASKKARQLMRRSTWVALAGIAIMAVTTIFIVQNSPSLTAHLKADRAVEKISNVKLAAYRYMKDKSMKVLSLVNDPHEGDQVAFKLSTTNPVHVALVASINHQAPEVLFQGARIPPGENRLLEKAGAKFIYDVNPSDKSMRFCLLFANTPRTLWNMINQVNIQFPKVPEAACLNLELKRD